MPGESKQILRVSSVAGSSHHTPEEKKLHIDLHYATSVLLIPPWKASLESCARDCSFHSRVGQVQELLRRERLQVDLVQLRRSHQHRLLRELNDSARLVSRELVPEDKGAALGAPLEDHHQVFACCVEFYRMSKCLLSQKKQ